MLLSPISRELERGSHIGVFFYNRSLPQKTHWLVQKESLGPVTKHTEHDENVFISMGSGRMCGMELPNVSGPLGKLKCLGSTLPCSSGCGRQGGTSAPDIPCGLTDICAGTFIHECYDLVTKPKVKHLCYGEDCASWNFGRNFDLLFLPNPLGLFLSLWNSLTRFPFLFSILEVNLRALPINFSWLSSVENGNWARQRSGHQFLWRHIQS